MILQQDDTNKLERNIFLLYVTAALVWGRFFIPVLALFYIASDVSLQEFSLIMGVFFATILLLEVPSGVIADFLGKRQTIIFAKFLFLVELLIVAFANGFWPFLIAKILSGVAVALMTGPANALVYDSLKRLGREKEHKKVAGKRMTITNMSMVVVFVTGSYLFALSPKLPAYVSIPFITLDLILMFFLFEAYKRKDKLNFASSFTHLRESFHHIKNHKELLGLLIYAAPLSAAVVVVYNFSSVYLATVSFPVALIGTLVAVGSLFSAAMSYWAHEIEEVFAKKTFLLIQLGIFIAIVVQALSYPVIGPLALLFIYIPFGLLSVLVNHYVNEYATTKHRATVLSINSLTTSLLLAILMPIVGALATDSFFIAYLLLLIPIAISLYANHLLRRPSVTA